jgi:hypothetical protein
MATWTRCLVALLLVALAAAKKLFNEVRRMPGHQRLESVRTPRVRNSTRERRTYDP